jgi:phage gp46-like protein
MTKDLMVHYHLLTEEVISLMHSDDLRYLRSRVLDKITEHFKELLQRADDYANEALQKLEEEQRSYRPSQ